MRELLSNNSPFVGQLYEDKSLALRARDLIFFTTDLQRELLLNNSLLELIYFLINADTSKIESNASSLWKTMENGNHHTTMHYNHSLADPCSFHCVV